ncbi:uncharacterized protein BDV14DRAFT_201173 [Aspergillus stella-maris]|uniref:uncharacterized protein n=1 Tax=Aspergillus stella-maris TaxID=1810926 RepID=UPI003CCE326D
MGKPKGFSSEITYMSFGDQGTTATVTEWGQHMQISQYLGHGTASIYTIDYKDTPEPYHASKRSQGLAELIEDKVGFGPDFVLPVLSGQEREWEFSASWLRNRWPRGRFTDKRGNWNISQQWYVHDGVVIQHFVLYNYSQEPMQLNINSNSDFVIREHEYVDGNHALNKLTEKSYHGPGPGGYGVVRFQSLQKNDNSTQASDQSQGPSEGSNEQHGGPDAVAAVMGLFVNGKAVTEADFERDVLRTVEANGMFQLVAGYKLVLLKKKTYELQDPDDFNWKRLTLRWEDVDINRFLAESVPRDFFLDDPILFSRDFYIGRQLEHILSVCMIPVSEGPVWDHKSLRDKDDKKLPVALTCGDMFSHRICVSASFFAFKFMLDVAKELPSEHPLRKRIQKECNAHLRWVFEKANKVDGSHFARNYWISGSIVPESPRLRRNGPTDTPFQILKAYAYGKVFPETSEEDYDLWKNTESFMMSWLSALDEENKRESYVWPHAQQEGMDYFRLDDNFWIWNAIKAISEKLDWTKKARKSSKLRRHDAVVQGTQSESELTRKYEPDKVKRMILQRFTTVHEAADQRLLAVTRSPRETRFVFHARDTALFYNLGLADDEFVSAKGDPRWLNTIQIQRRFPQYQGRHSNNPLHRALAMFVARHEVPVWVGRLEEVKEVKKMLTETMLDNGLFPGQIGDTGETDSTDHHPDSLANVSFEVPYLLLNHSDIKLPVMTVGRTLANPKQQDKSDMSTAILYGKVPFNQHIDQKNIVDVKDGWLYNWPDFFDWKIPDPLPSPRDLYFSHHSKKPSETRKDTDETFSLQVLDLAILSCHFCNPKDNLKKSDIAIDRPGSKQGLIDLGKKQQKQTSVSLRKSSIQGIWDRLCEPRTIYEAKKRFMWSQTPHNSYILMCYLLSPPTERSQVASFFDRHARSVTFFEDITRAVQNVWTTEFHCGFFQCVDQAKHTIYTANEEPRFHLNDSILKQRNMKPLKLPIGGQTILRASAGFRFNGDFPDRFWTCHYLESYGDTAPGDINDILTKEYIWGSPEGGSDKVWKQRKVFELILFRRAISKVNVNAHFMIKKIRDALDQDPSRETTLKNDRNVTTYFVQLNEWSKIHEILECLSDDLDRILDHIKRWNCRDQDRQTENPRWTDKDERKYRDAINISLTYCQNVERELKVREGEVAALKYKLGYLDKERKNAYDLYMAERSFRQNSNIMYFTYSTVIFLPLGFATSIYSMQAAPSSEIVQYMAICAVVALAVLVIAAAIVPYFLKRLHRNFSEWLERLYQNLRQNWTSFSQATRREWAKWARSIGRRPEKQDSSLESGRPDSESQTFNQSTHLPER